MRIAFFADKPTKSTRPTWVYRLLSSPAIRSPTAEPNIARGTIRMTAMGSAQLSYNAARIRTTTNIAAINTMAPFPADFFSWNAMFVHSNDIPGGSTFAANCSMVPRACPELYP